MEKFESLVSESFSENRLFMGRMISGSKSEYRQRNPENEVIFNANIFILGEGKVWWGDLDLTLDHDSLQSISKKIGKKLYILREMDGRFENENASDPHVIKYAAKVIEPWWYISI